VEAEIAEAQDQGLVIPLLGMYHKQVQNTGEAFWDEQVLLGLKLRMRGFEEL
jgi:hypothetical protein